MGETARTLAIDTTTRTGSVAVYSVNPGESAEIVLEAGKNYAETLLSSINRLFEMSGLQMENMELIAVANGPGSFTGLRIGLATAKGLSFSSGVPVKTVSTLEALAGRIIDSPSIICPVLDARRGEVYSAFFRRERDGSLIKTSPELASRIEDICTAIDDGAVFLGDGVDTYEKKIRLLMGERAVFAPAHLRYPSALAVAQTALKKIAAGEKAETALAVKPLYVRQSDAEIKHG